MTVSGLPYHLRSLGKSQALSFDVKSEFLFKLVPETNFLRVLKKIGFGSEIQIGDLVFDDRFYVASHDTGFLEHLKSNSDLRRQFISIADRGWTKISCLGQVLTFERPGDSWSEEDEKYLEPIVRSISLENREKGQKDPYRSRLIALELIFHSLFAYLVSSYVGLEASSWAIPVIDPGPMFMTGLKVGALLCATWVLIIYITLGKSSHAPLLIKETLLFSFIGVIFFGPFVVFDVNQNFDFSQPLIEQVNVRDKVLERSGRGKSSRASFYLIFDQRSNVINRSKIQVNPVDYWRVTPPQQVSIHIGVGFLGSAYIREIIPGQPIQPQKGSDN